MILTSDSVRGTCEIARRLHMRCLIDLRANDATREIVDRDVNPAPNAGLATVSILCTIQARRATLRPANTFGRSRPICPQGTGQWRNR